MLWGWWVHLQGQGERNKPVRLPLQRKSYAGTPDRESCPLPSTWGLCAVLAWANKWRLKTREISGTEKCQNLRVGYSLKENRVWLEATLLTVWNLKGEKIKIWTYHFQTTQLPAISIVRIGQTEWATEMLTCCTGSNLVAMLFKLFCLFNSQRKK